MIREFLSGLYSRVGETYNYFTDGEIAYGTHYSLVRHSRPFIVYQGTKTSVKLTVLGDAPLSAGRRVFLQRRGYRTGLLGWTVGGLLGGSHLPGIDVTPDERITLDSLPAKQRAQLDADIERLFSSSFVPNEQKQVPLETLMIHIPVRASDGYYRLRITADHVGRKEVAASPVFRVGSISWASACPRGATPLGIVPELLVRSAFEVGRTAAYASFYATFPFLKLAEYTPGPWRTYALRALYSRALTEEQQAQVTDGFARGREGVQHAHEKVLRTVPFGAVGVRSAAELERDEAIGRAGWWLTR